MEIITGYTGENHVTSMDDASLYRGIFGQGDYVLDVGNKFAATIIDNNTVRIMDGDLVIQGHQARIRANDYEEVTIDNGTPGEKRNDLIVARYQKNTTTGIESITLEVVKGTPGETATDPEIIQEDLTIGGIQRDYPLYRVSLNGLVLESVTSLFTVLPNFEDFESHLADTVTDNVHGLADKVIIETGNNANGRYIKFGDGTMICYGSISKTLSIDIAFGSLFRNDDNTLVITYPVSFYGTAPALNVFNNGSTTVFFANQTTGTVSEARLYALRPAAFTDSNIRLNWCAIGRWK